VTSSVSKILPGWRKPLLSLRIGRPSAGKCATVRPR